MDLCIRTPPAQPPKNVTLSPTAVCALSASAREPESGWSYADIITQFANPALPIDGARRRYIRHTSGHRCTGSVEIAEIHSPTENERFQTCHDQTNHSFAIRKHPDSTSTVAEAPRERKESVRPGKCAYIVRWTLNQRSDAPVSLPKRRRDAMTGTVRFPGVKSKGRRSRPLRRIRVDRKWMKQGPTRVNSATRRF